MGSLAALFHVRPWEHDLLTVWEYYSLTLGADKMGEANGGS